MQEIGQHLDVERVGRDPGRGHDGTADDLAEGAVGQAHGMGLAHRLVVEQRVDDVLRLDVDPAGDDEGLLAADDGDEAVFVLGGEIAGVEPAVDDGLGGELGLVEIALHDVLAADEQLADLASRHSGARVVGDPDLAIDRLADGAEPEAGRVRAAVERLADGFGEAVGVDHAHREPLFDRLPERRRQAVAAGADVAEIRRVEGVLEPAVQPVDHREQRRDDDEMGDPVTVDGQEQVFDLLEIEGPRPEQRGPGEEGDDRPVHQPVGEMQGQRVQDPAVGSVAVDAEKGVDLRGDVRPAELDHLGLAGGAGSEQHHRGRLGGRRAVGRGAGSGGGQIGGEPGRCCGFRGLAEEPAHQPGAAFGCAVGQRRGFDAAGQARFGENVLVDEDMGELRGGDGEAAFDRAQLRVHVDDRDAGAQGCQHDRGDLEGRARQHADRGVRGQPLGAEDRVELRDPVEDLAVARRLAVDLEKDPFAVCPGDRRVEKLCQFRCHVSPAGPSQPLPNVSRKALTSALRSGLPRPTRGKSRRIRTRCGAL